MILFEPSARERRRVRLNCWLNRVQPTIERFAIGAAHRQSEFFVVTRRFKTMNSLRRPHLAEEQPVRKQVVETMPLDQYCRLNGIARIDLVKLVIEGGELDAIEGP